jgi:transient receptor potential cation channel subfamily M protein 2
LFFVDLQRDCLLQVTSNNLIDFRQTRALLGESVSKTLDVHHTHFLLFDDGRLDYYINDGPRTKFVKTACEQTDCHPVTIIVEGGVNALEVILNDLQAKRPVVIVDGSGRLANVLGKLFENASETTVVG